MKDIYLYFKPIYEFIESYQAVQLGLLSLITFIVLLAIQKLLYRNVDKNKTLDSDDQIIAKRDISSTMNVIFFVLMAIVWFSGLQSVFVTFIALAAAIAIAGKELIMCFLGGILIKINHYFKISDRIEINGIRGYVIEKNFTTTKILEIGPERHSQQTNGKVITIPNSLMLMHFVKNESYFKGFSIKTFNFKIPRDIDLHSTEKLLLEWGKEISRPYYNEARESIKQNCQKEGILLPSMSPKTKIAIDDNNEWIIMLKIPVRNKIIADIEQDLLRKFYHHTTSK